MKNFKRRIKKPVFILIVLIFLILNSNAQTSIYKYSNIFETLFTEPFEMCFFIFKDGTLYGMTDMDEQKINFEDTRLLVTYFDKNNLKIKDLIIVIHNHPDLSRFSDKDVKFYWELKRYGFNGFFLLYLATGKIIEYPDNARKRGK